MMNVFIPSCVGEGFLQGKNIGRQTIQGSEGWLVDGETLHQIAPNMELIQMDQDLYTLDLPKTSNARLFQILLEYSGIFTIHSEIGACTPPRSCGRTTRIILGYPSASCRRRSSYDVWMQPSGLGESIWSKEDDSFAIGEAFLLKEGGMDVYLLFRSNHHDVIADEIKNAMSSFLTWHRNMEHNNTPKSERFQSMQEGFVEGVSKLQSQEQIAYQRRIERAERDQAYHVMQYSENLLKFKLEKRIHEAEQTELNDLRRSIIEGLEPLKTCPRLKALEYNNSKITLHTTSIVMEDEENEERYDFGPFTINIPLETGILDITVQQEESWPKHPYLDAGHLSSMMRCIAEMYAQFNFYGITTILIRFLETFDPDKFGKKQ